MSKFIVDIAEEVTVDISTLSPMDIAFVIGQGLAAHWMVSCRGYNTVRTELLFARITHRIEADGQQTELLKRPWPLPNYLYQPKDAEADGGDQR